MYLIHNNRISAALLFLLVAVSFTSCGKKLPGRYTIPGLEGVTFVDGPDKSNLVGLKLRVVTQPSYPDDVVVELTLTNRTSKTIGICTFGTPFRHGEIIPNMFEVKNSKGELLEYQLGRVNWGSESPCRNESDFIIIPRISIIPIRGYVNLADSYKFLPGKYTVQYISPMDDLAESNEIEIVVEDPEMKTK